MTLVDIVVLAVLAVTLVLGMIRGFLPQIVGIVGILGGIYLASRYAETVERQVLDPMIATGHNGTVAFVAIIVASVLVVALIGWILRKAVMKLQLSPYDRLMGGALGALKGALICAGLLLAVVYFAPNGGEIERQIGKSRAAPMLWRAMARVARLLPEGMRPKVEEFLNENRLPPAPGEAPPPGPRAE